METPSVRRRLLFRRERWHGHVAEGLLHLELVEASARSRSVLRRELEVALPRPVRHHANDVGEVALDVEPVEDARGDEREEVGGARDVQDRGRRRAHDDADGAAAAASEQAALLEADALGLALERGVQDFDALFGDVELSDVSAPRRLLGPRGLPVALATRRVIVIVITFVVVVVVVAGPFREAARVELIGLSLGSIMTNYDLLVHVGVGDLRFGRSPTPTYLKAPFPPDAFASVRQ